MSFIKKGYDKLSRKLNQKSPIAKWKRDKKDPAVQAKWAAKRDADFKKWRAKKQAEREAAAVKQKPAQASTRPLAAAKPG